MTYRQAAASATTRGNHELDCREDQVDHAGVGRADTLEFVSWGKSLKQGQLPAMTASKIATIRSLIHWELAGVVLIILCVALMAKGFGVLG